MATQLLQLTSSSITAGKYRVDIVLRERLLSRWYVVAEGQHSNVNAGLVGRRDADSFLQEHGPAVVKHYLQPLTTDLLPMICMLGVWCAKARQGMWWACR